MRDIFEKDDLPRYYVEHYPPMLYAERDLESFDTLEDAENFAEDCARGGEDARIFGEMTQIHAADYGPGRENGDEGAGLDQDWPDWLAA